MKMMSALDLRKKLGSVLNMVSKNNEQVMISRANKPLAVIISVEEYQDQVLQRKRGQKLKEISAKMEEWKKKHRKETSQVDVVKILREMRETRW